MNNLTLRLGIGIREKIVGGGNSKKEWFIIAPPTNNSITYF